jgi:cytochrome P450
MFIAKGDCIDVVFGAMHYDKDIWGEDADVFRPERWENIKKPGWTYIPFSAGRRVCPGQQITLTENAYVLIRLMRKFKALENRDPVLEFVEQNRLTVESRHGVQIGLIPIDS